MIDYKDISPENTIPNPFTVWQPTGQWIEKELFVFDEILVFTFLQDGKRYFALKFDEFPTHQQYIVSPLSDEGMAAVQANTLIIRDIFNEELYVVNGDVYTSVEHCWKVNPASMPADMMPDPHLNLRR